MQVQESDIESHDTITDRYRVAEFIIRGCSRPKWSDPMGEEFIQEVAFQNSCTWLMEDVNKNNNTNLYAVTLEKQLLHWI